MKFTKAFAAFLALSLVLVCAIAAVKRQPVYATAPTAILTGTCISQSDGTVTNFFSPVFSTLPAVVMTQVSSVNHPTNRVLVLATNFFVASSIASGVTNNWIAIGRP